MSIQLPFTASHAFIVGINDYQHLTPLSTAVNDAQVIAENLENQHGFKVHPPLLNATHESLRKLLTKDIPQLVGKDDRVLFYFAGHGIALDGEEGPNGYLVAADTRPGQEETLIPMQTLHDALTGLPCRHGLLILDCCFSGAFKWSSGYRDVIFDLPKVIYEERFWRYCKDEAWQVITSSAHDQKAVDIITNKSLGLREEGGRENHSPFASSLIKALAGEGDTIPAGEGDGVMTATEIYAYLRDSVETQTTGNTKRQSPSLFNLQRHDKGEFIFLTPNHRFNLPPTPDKNPFMGLSSFNEEDANLFYGRDRVVAALLDKVKQQALLVVSGASGTGKSSVIKAGVLPQLRKQGYTVLPIIRPGKEPLQTIASELPDIRQQLTAGLTVLVIDQYEELITQCLKEEDRLAFEQQIADWLEQYPQLRIMLSIRSDFEPQFESEILALWWQKGRYVVPAFSLEEIREVITKPAAQAVLFYEPEDLVEQLSEEVSQAPGALPLLSFTLSELYHTYLKSGREDRALTEADYNHLGGVIGALRTRADAEYQALNPGEQSSMRKLMLRMVSLEGGELAGKRIYTEELQFTSTAETERLQTIANQLVDARLLLKGTDGQGRSYIEPAHDALVRAWGRLWEWIKTVGEEKIALQYKLSQAVNDYQGLLIAEPKKARNLLWNNNPRLDLLQAELGGKNHGFNAQEEVFVRSSVQRRSARKRTGWGIAVAVMVGLASLSVFAFAQRDEALAQTQLAEAQTQLAEEKTQEARDSAMVAQEQRHVASNKAQEAVDSAAVAKQQRLWALLQADTARLERDNANIQTILARQAQLKAEQSLRDAKSAGTAAKAREVLATDPTIALNLALAAYRLSPTGESTSAINDIMGNQENRFYEQDFIGHRFAVTSVAFSPDSETILTGSADGTIKLWNNSGDELGTFNGHNASITGVAFSPDGKTVLTGGHDDTAKLWDMSGRELKTFAGHGAPVTSVAFSPDGQAILTGSEDKSAKLWSLKGEELQAITGHSAPVTSVAFSPDGQKILTGSRDKTARLWSLSGEELQTFLDHEEDITSVAFSPDGQRVLTGSFDKTAKLWSLSGEQLQVFTGHKHKISSVAFSPDGQRVLTGSYDNTAKLWSLDGHELKTFAGHDPSVLSVAFSPDGQMILTGSGDQTAKLWSLLDHELHIYAGHTGAITSVCFSSNGQTVLTGSEDKTAKLWALSGQEIRTFTGHQDIVTSVAFSPDGQFVLTGSKDGTAKLWSSLGQEIRTFAGHNSAVSNVCFSPDGQAILTGSGNGARLWDLSGQELHNYVGRYPYTTKVFFSPDGQNILTGSQRDARLWDLSGDALKSFYYQNDPTNHSIVSLAFSPDGQNIFAVGDGGMAALWNFSGNRLIHTCHIGPGAVTSVVFSPDGQTLLTGSRDRTATLWGLSGNELQTFAGHENYITSVCFSPNGQTVLTGSADGTAKLWSNVYTEYASGALWKRLHKLHRWQQTKYKIDWEY